MRIIDKINATPAFVSLEFFPPKEQDKWTEFFAVVERLKAIAPLFASVTYGAGGSTQANTLAIVSRLKRDLDLEPMAHLTCVGAEEASIDRFLDSLRSAGVDNVLALRGDPPQGQASFVPDNERFRHASDLVAHIRGHRQGMGVAVAGYPEKHPEAPSLEADIAHLRRKVDLGGDFIVTQLFFDNDLYFDFAAKVRAAGMDQPVVPGVLPVSTLGGLKRILSLCGASVPPGYLAELEKADAEGGAAAVARLGVAYATRQAQNLLDRGAPGVHLYTLNKAEACLEIVGGLDR